jgi:hypothetical protein
MCLACEEQEYFFRIWCAGFLARGEMPPGVSTEDLEALGLPLPKKRDDSAGQEPDKAAKQDRKAQRSTPGADAFACDSPDE